MIAKKSANERTFQGILFQIVTKIIRFKFYYEARINRKKNK